MKNKKKNKNKNSKGISQLVHLKTQLANFRKTKAYSATPFPRYLQQDVVRYAQQELAKGTNIQQVANKLEMNRSLLVGWYNRYAEHPMTSEKPKEQKLSRPRGRPRKALLSTVIPKPKQKPKEQKQKPKVKPKVQVQTYHMQTTELDAIAEQRAILEARKMQQEMDKTVLTIVTPNNYKITLINPSPVEISALMQQIKGD